MNIKTLPTLPSRLLTPVDKISLGANIRREPSRDRFVDWGPLLGPGSCGLQRYEQPLTTCFVRTLNICLHYSVPLLPCIERYCGSKQTHLVFILIDYAISRTTMYLELQSLVVRVGVCNQARGTSIMPRPLL